MKRIVDPFTVNFPHLDLHGETSFSIVYLINSFIKDSIKLKEYKVVIVHGKGSGILKKKTHELLKINKAVKRYYIDGMNDGQTIVELKN